MTKPKYFKINFAVFFRERPYRDLPTLIPKAEKNLLLTVEMTRDEVTTLNINKTISSDEIDPRMPKKIGLHYHSTPHHHEKISGRWHFTNLLKIYKHFTFL